MIYKMLNKQVLLGVLNMEGEFCQGFIPSTIEYKTNRSECRMRHVGRFVFFCSKGLRRFLSPSACLAITRVSGN